MAKKILHDYTGALGDYDEAVRLAPTSFIPLVSRASTREECGDYKGTITDYTALVELMRSRKSGESYIAVYEATYLRDRARVENMIGDENKAIDDLSEAKLLSPNETIERPLPLPSSK